MSGEPEPTPMDAASLQHRAARGTWWTLLNVAVSLPIAFLANAIVARVLGVGDYGRLALLTVVIALVTQLTDLGVGDATVQYAARAHARGLPRDVDDLLGRGLGFRLLVQVPLLAVAVVATLAGEPGWVVAVGLVGALVPPLVGAGPQSLTIESRTDLAARFGLLGNVLTQVGGVLAAWLTASAAAVWGMRTLAGVLVLPFILLALEARRRRAALTPRDPRRVPEGFRRFALRTWAAAVLATIVLSRTEVLVLQWLADAAAVGVFALAASVAAQVTGPVAALVNPLVPASVGLLATAPDRVPAAFDRVMRVAGLGAGALVATAVPTLVPLVGTVFGAGFTDASPHVAVLVAAVCLAVLAGPGQVFLRAREQTGLLLVTTAIAAAVDIGLALALVPALGAWGATIAFAATNAVLATVWLGAERRSEGRPATGLVRDLTPWLAGCAAAAAGVLATAPVRDAAGGAVAAVVGFLIGAAVLLVLVRVGRLGLTDRDVEVVVGALPRPVRRMVTALGRLVRAAERDPAP